MGHRRVYYIRRIERPSESENDVKRSENWAFKEKHFNWRLLLSKITVIAKLYETLLRLCFPNEGAHYKNIDFQVLLWANKSVFDKLYKRLLGSHQPAQYQVTPQTQFMCLWRWQKLLQQELHTNNNLGNFKSSLSQLSAFLIFFIFLAKSEISWLGERSQLLPELSPVMKYDHLLLPGDIQSWATGDHHFFQ